MRSSLSGRAGRDEAGVREGCARRQRWSADRHPAGRNLLQRRSVRSAAYACDSRTHGSRDPPSHPPRSASSATACSSTACVVDDALRRAARARARRGRRGPGPRWCSTPSRSARACSTASRPAANAEFVKPEFEKAARELRSGFAERAARRRASGWPGSSRRPSGPTTAISPASCGATSPTRARRRAAPHARGSSRSCCQGPAGLPQQLLVGRRPEPARRLPAALELARCCRPDARPAGEDLREMREAARRAAGRRSQRAARREGEQLESWRRARAGHRQGPQLRGGGVRGGRRDRARPRATTPRPSATSRARRARPATSSSPSTAAAARRAGGSSSRPRTRGSRGPRRCANSTARCEERDAEFAVLVVPAEDKLPARTLPLRERTATSWSSTYDPEDGSRSAWRSATRSPAPAC